MRRVYHLLLYGFYLKNVFLLLVAWLVEFESRSAVVAHFVAVAFINEKIETYMTELSDVISIAFAPLKDLIVESWFQLVARLAS